MESSASVASASPSSAAQTINMSNGGTMSVKTFYYLISTMNNMFPDYDFSDIPVDAFTRITQLSGLRNHFNASLFNTGIDRNTTSFSNFTSKMWSCMDDAVGGLEESEMFTFDPDSFEIDDPFRERGTMYQCKLLQFSNFTFTFLDGH